MAPVFPTWLAVVLLSAPPAPPARGGAAPAAPSAAECAQALDRGQPAEAAALARRRLQAVPRDAATHIVLARALAALGKLDDAYETFRRALGVDPRSPDALYYLGITSAVLAQAEYERLFALAPDSTRARQLQAQSYQAQGRPHEAIAAYQAALQSDPRSVEVLIELGDLMRSQMRLDEAFSYYARAAALAPHRYEVLYGLGVSLAYRRDYAAAIDRLREALAVDPTSASARFNLGRALLLSGQAAAAASELEAVTAREPRMREAHYMLGRAYQALGRGPEAERAFARVRELASQGVTAAEPDAEPQ
jgi:tetratricopeptide (TPR) repeat protein